MSDDNRRRPHGDAQYSGRSGETRQNPNKKRESVQRKPDPALEEDSPADGIAEGKNPVLEAIKAGRKIDKLYIAAESRDNTLRFIAAKAKETGAVVIETERERLDAMSVTRAHQGVIAVMPVREYTELEALLSACKNPALLVICDGITDPNNLGAIIRTAETAGADGVIIPKRRSAGLTAAVAKASAGAVEYMKVARVTNISALLRELKERGFWIFGAAGESAQSIYNSDFTSPSAIVIGSEGEGVSRVVLENCDFRIAIPMFGSVSSLNASNAAAVILYEAVRQRLSAGQTAAK